jgi:hypothetical protein
MILTEVRSEYYIVSLPAVNQRIPSHLSKDQLTEYIPNLSPTSLDTRSTKRLTEAGDVGLRFCMASAKINYISVIPELSDQPSRRAAGALAELDASRSLRLKITSIP